MDGDIIAGKRVIQACQRHLRDLKSGSRRGLVWDPDAAQHAIDFFQFLKHTKGEWAGTTVRLEPWQQFIFGCVFGWYRKDGTRRYRVAYIEVARKNGKSTALAGIGLYLMVADGEEGADVYSIATKKDQARIVWEDARRMVMRSPALRELVQPLKNNLNMELTSSKFEPLGSDDDTLDGLNPHGVIVDELHAHKDRGAWDVMKSALGARRQPLMIAITTAGFNQNGIGFEQHEYAEKVLSRTIEDDTFFAYVATIDKGDDWADEKVWAKANPNLGISVKLDYLRAEARVAKEMPSALNNFLTKHLNVWTQQAERWIPLTLWDKNAGIVVEEKLAGRKCYGGLDLSAVSDLTAWLMMFPRDDDPEEVDVLLRAWVPEARLHDSRNRYRDSYQAWVKQGFLAATPGDAIDYGFIKAQILADAQKFQIQDLNIDRLFNAHQVAMELAEEGLTVVGMGQGFLSMAAPMKEFERRLLARKIHHGGNPVLRWAADNVAVKKDAAGNLKPDKAKSQGKIDPIVALVMALDRAMRHENGSSVYEERGLLFL